MRLWSLSPEYLDKPLDYINAYLSEIYQEALNRGYLFNKSKISSLKKKLKNIKVSIGQYEFKHLLNKLKIRDKNRYQS